MKKFLVIVILTLIVFSHTGVAHALTLKDVKNFLIGETAPKDKPSDNDVVGEQTASVLSFLRSTDIVRIASAEEVEEVDENSSSFIFTIEAGDTLWGRIDAQITEAIPDMEESQMLYTIDRIIDEMRDLPQENLTSLGVSSGNVDLIYPGESITFVVQVSEGGEPTVQAL